MKKAMILLTVLIGLIFADAPKLEYPELNPIQIPEYEKYKLDNGMTIYLMEDHEFPVITAYMRVDARSLYDPVEKIGLAEMTSDMLRLGGAGDRSADEVDLFLESIGAEFDVSANVNRATVEVKSLTDNFEDVFSLFADALRRPAFDEEKIDWMKKQWKNGIMHRNDQPDGIIEREFPKALLGADHPYARHEEIYNIDAITRDDVVAFHKDYYVPPNADLGIVGDFDTDEMKALIEKYFGDWQGQMPEKTPLPDFPPVEETKVFFIQKDGLNQATIQMGHLGIREDSTDYYASNLIGRILGAGRDARLYKEVRYNRGWAYTVSGWIGSGMDHPENFSIFLQTKAQNAVDAVELIKDEIVKFQSEPPTKDELTKAKSAYENAYPFRFSSPIANLRLAMVYDYYGYPQDFQETMLENVRKQTGDDVFKASRRLLRPEKMAIVIVGDTATIDGLERLGQVEMVDIEIPMGDPNAPSIEKTEETLKKGSMMMDKVVSFIGSVENVKDARIIGTATVAAGPQTMDIDVSNDFAFVSPSKIKSTMTMPFGVITQGFDGEKAWIKMPQGSQYLDGADAMDIKRSLFGNLVNLARCYEKGTLEANYIGDDEIDGKPCQAVNLSQNDLEVTLLIDGDSGEVLGKTYKGVSQSGLSTFVETYDDYRAISGVKFPHKVATTMDGQDYSETIVSKVELNKGLSEFDKPE